jgi:16S rRNA (guanine527-N7)-methyltransferase
LNDQPPGSTPLPKALDLLEKSQAVGLIGSGPLEPHVRHSLGFADVLGSFWGDRPAGYRLLDLGSGGGVPGLVLAEVWPGISVTLLDAGVRRCQVLQDGIDEAGWESRVSVICGRAEDLARVPDLRGTFDAVVARSFGPPGVTAECGSGFLSVGGLLVVSDPPDRARWSDAGLDILGLRTDSQISEPFHFSVFRQVEACPEAYPRRNGIPAKRPLF